MGSDFGLSSGSLIFFSARIEWGWMGAAAGGVRGIPASSCCDATITLFFPFIEEALPSFCLSREMSWGTPMGCPQNVRIQIAQVHKMRAIQLFNKPPVMPV
jgi:hypothetical protein